MDIFLNQLFDWTYKPQKIFYLCRHLISKESIIYLYSIDFKFLFILRVSSVYYFNFEDNIKTLIITFLYI